MKKILLVVTALILLVLAALYSAYRHDTAAPTVSINIPQIEQPTPEVDPRPEVLEKYFARKGMPMAEYANILVAFADEYGIDWRLLAAISVRESSGGLEMCTNNPFGWDSCDGPPFKDIESAISFISERLANSPYYAGKSLYEKLSTYNSVIPTYADEVINIMQQIQKD